jgi:hypothetical protein
LQGQRIEAQDLNLATKYYESLLESDGTNVVCTLILLHLRINRTSRLGSMEASYRSATAAEQNGEMCYGTHNVPRYVLLGPRGLAGTGRHIRKPAPVSPPTPPKEHI